MVRMIQKIKFRLSTESLFEEKACEQLSLKEIFNFFQLSKSSMNQNLFQPEEVFLTKMSWKVRNKQVLTMGISLKPDPPSKV